MGKIPSRFPQPAIQRCHLTRSGVQTIPNGAWTNILFDQETYDVGDLHSLVSNTDRINITVKGIYLIIGTLRFVANNTGDRGLRIRQNTTLIGYISKVAPSITCSQNIVLIMELDAGTYIELGVYQNSGGNLDVMSQGTSFAVIKLLS